MNENPILLSLLYDLDLLPEQVKSGTREEFMMLRIKAAFAALEQPPKIQVVGSDRGSSPEKI
jgi:hypothetical protein